MDVLTIDVGGSHVKLLATGQSAPRKFASGPKMTPERMIDGVKQRIDGWRYESVTIGYPGPVLQGKLVAEPHNLGSGWLGVDFAKAFDRPVKLINDAALQALGDYRGGKMLFLGLGTGLGTALIVDGVIEPLELGHLPYKRGTFEDYVGQRGLDKHGSRKWRRHVADVIERLAAALQPDDIVLGGGNARRLKPLPEGCRLGEPMAAFEGGFRLWEDKGHPVVAGSNQAPRLQSEPANPTSEKRTMQLGMIGLGRMGANLVRRLTRGGHSCVVYDQSPEAVAELVKQGSQGAASLAEFVEKLEAPRTVWLMAPAAAVDGLIGQLRPLLAAGDTLIDGGNSYYVDDIRRAEELSRAGLHYVDVGTSGGVWGLERGYCLMIGGEPEIVRRLDPIFATLAPGVGAIARTPGREALGGTAEQGYLHCGPHGAGHFVKMVHNGIEYGLMAAYAEGLGVLRDANIGRRSQAGDAETTPLRDPAHYQYDLNLADVTEVWRRGSVIASWLLDLTATALAQDTELASFAGRVSDSGEGRWTIKAAIDEGVPAPVLSAALYERFSSRGDADFQDKLLSAMRYQFGGHVEKH